jgi:hypothetical protein
VQNAGVSRLRGLDREMEVGSWGSRVSISGIGGGREDDSPGGLRKRNRWLDCLRRMDWLWRDLRDFPMGGRREFGSGTWRRLGLGFRLNGSF